MTGVFCLQILQTEHGDKSCEDSRVREQTGNEFIQATNLDEKHLNPVGVFFKYTCILSEKRSYLR